MNTESPELNTSNEFLNLLDEGSEQWTWLTLDDSKRKVKRKSLVRVLHGSFERYLDELAELNRRGAGVFVTVNATDLHGREASNVERVRAVFVDLDGAPLEPVLKAPLAPTIIVESSARRYHAYWTIADCPLDLFKPLQQNLAKQFGGDSACCDLPRVMRLPGFWHRKADPFQTHIIQTGPGGYTLEQFQEAFQFDPEAVRKRQTRADQTASAEASGAPLDASERQRIEAALQHVPADDYGVWLQVGMALHSTGAADGFEVWRGWSAKSTKFDEAVCLDKWQSFNGTGITLATVFGLAKDSGWTYRPEDQADQEQAAATGDNPKTEDPFSLTQSGVYRRAEDDDGAAVWVCSPLRVTARTRDSGSELWGYLLEWPDPAGVQHTWPMPAELLRGTGEEYRGVLLNGGLLIAPGSKARNALATYIQTRRPAALARCTDKVGWHDGVFVLPDRNIGQSDERLLYQTATRSNIKVSSRGTLKDWQENVSSLCTGNSRLTLAISTALASPLLELTQDENGGVHLTGSSSSGKTTALRAAASVYGGPDYLQRWRATDNGLEAIAAAANDLLLVLDEIGQIDGRRAGEIAYMLANGSGKHRANRLGLSRPAASWRLLFLSSGETGLADLMMEAGKKAKAGQEIRLLDIPADAGAGLGLFEALHNFPSGASFADHLCQAAAQSYGTAGPAFIEVVIKDRDNLLTAFQTKRDEIRDSLLADHQDASGQTARAAARFALIAAAGELATQHGITGWDTGQAAAAAATCFKAWLTRRGGPGDQEQREILRQVRLFFELHGESRFIRWNTASEDNRTIINRAGAVRFQDEEPAFFVLPEVFRQEVCKGLDYRLALKVLEQAGILEPGDKTPSSLHRLPGIGPKKVYVLRPFKDDEKKSTG